MKYYKYYLLSIGIIILDQVVKLLVHFNMDMGIVGQIPVFGDWFKLHYTLNPGMAFGITLGSDYGKLILTVFRIFAGIGIAYVMARAALRDAPKGFVVSMALILGGAFGNIVDSTFYGVFIEGNAVRLDGNTPNFYPWFHGQVIDMFYFDIASGYFPENIPFVGGDHYSFFPIFNIADAAIFIGVCIILIWQKRFFPKEEVEVEVEKSLEEGIKEENDTNESRVLENDNSTIILNENELRNSVEIDTISEDENIKKEE